MLAAATILLAIPAAAAPTGLRWHVHGPPGGTVSAIEIDPRSPSVVYAGTFGAGVYRSTNAGRSWQRRSRGLPPDTLVLALELAPSQPSTLYLEAYQGQRVFRSTNGGASWTAAAQTDGPVNDLDVDPAQARKLYLATFSGLLRSTDGGTSWAHIGPALRHPARLAVSPSSPNVMYAEDEGRIMRSADGGALWSQRLQTLESFQVFEVDPRDPNTLYASTNDALLKSSDGGAHFTRVRTGGFGLQVYALAFDPRDSRRLYAGTFWRGVFRSSDGGVDWTHVAGLPRERVHDLAVGGSRLYAGVDHRGLYVSGGGPCAHRTGAWSGRRCARSGSIAPRSEPSSPALSAPGSGRRGTAGASGARAASPGRR